MHEKLGCYGPQKGPGRISQTLSRQKFPEEEKLELVPDHLLPSQLVPEWETWELVWNLKFWSRG